MKRPSSMVLVALLLSAACSALQAEPTSADASSCSNKCWSLYNAVVEDCVNKADVTSALRPVQEQRLFAGSTSRPRYNGPQVDVLKAVRAQCRSNVGTSQLNACILACSPSPAAGRAPVGQPPAAGGSPSGGRPPVIVIYNTDTAATMRGSTQPAVGAVGRRAPSKCEDVCRAQHQPNTLGRLRCLMNC